MLNIYVPFDVWTQHPPPTPKVKGGGIISDSLSIHIHDTMGVRTCTMT